MYSHALLSQGFAQTPLSLAEAVSFALSHRPEIRAAADRTAAAKDLRKQAGLIPNPRIFLQSEDLRSSHFNFWQDSETFAYVGETLETLGDAPDESLRPPRGLRVPPASRTGAS